MKTEDMSDEDEHDDIIRNHDTRSRRAWVNRAVEGVRRRLERGEEIPRTAPPERSRPQLTVVSSPPKR
jgi:hypothetical protein